jgi:predicted dehydrogenase
MIRIGLIGAGYIARVHASVLQHQVENASIAAVADTVDERRAALAEELGVPSYHSAEEMLESEPMDAVAVCTPTASHAEYLILAARSGKHVFCEKPLALSLEEADRMIEMVQTSGVTAMSGHVLRFWPVYTKAKEILDSGELGLPIHGYCERLIAMPDWQAGAWHLRQKGGAAAALDVQIHDLDYLTWLFGKPLTIRSNGFYDEGRGGWMHMNSRVEFEKGRVGVVQAGWGFHRTYPFTMTLRIMAEDGVVEWNFKAGKLLETRDRAAPLCVYRDGESRVVDGIDQSDPFLLQWRYFVDRLERGAAIDMATLEHGRVALELALGSIESARRNVSVKLGT